MAKKGGSKGGVLNENYQYITTDQRPDEECVNKIKRLHEIFPSSSKSDISIVLESYNFDEDKAADALANDGGKKALSSWTVHGNNKSKSNKSKKKNKKRDKKNIQDSSSAANCTEGDDSSSLHSNNVDQELDKDIGQKTESEEFLPGVEPEIQHDDCETNIVTNNNSLDLPPASFGKIENHVDENQTVSETDVQPELTVDSNSNIQCVEKQHSENNNNNNNNRVSLPMAQAHHSLETETKEIKYSPREEDRSVQARSSPRQRTNSSQRSKMPSFSEDYSSSGSLASQVTNAPTAKVFDKCKKDLNRQAVSLQRIENLVEKGLDESSKRLKISFQDIRKLLDKRQEQLEEEMSQVKETAMRLLKQRRDLATELKKRVDRSQSLSESDWNMLRGNIKQFVVERKYDDELGRTVWFCWSDEILEEVKKFGEVVPVKNSYNQQLLSIINPEASSANIPEPSHSPSPSSEDTSTQDRNDVHTLVDLAETGHHLPEEKVMMQNKSNTPGIRVFSNKRYNSPNYVDRFPHYNNNRARNPWRGRGHMGGRFPRPRQFEPRYYGGNDRTENRAPSVDKQQTNYSTSEHSANTEDTNTNSAYAVEGHGFMKQGRRGQYSGYRQMRTSHPFRHGRGANFSRGTGESFNYRTEPSVSNTNGKQNYTQGSSDNVNGLDSH